MREWENFAIFDIIARYISVTVQDSPTFAANDYRNKNSSGDEIANVNFLTTISHTRRPTLKYRKRENLLCLTN